MTYQDYVRACLLQECYSTLSANDTESKILDFEDIEDGWHFGEGTVLSRKAIQEACRLHDTLLEYGFYETDAFPGLAGEIRVTAYWEDHYFEFTREPDGKWRFIEEVNGAEIEDLERDGLHLPDAQKVVEEIAQRLWTTFATFQEDTGTTNCNDFKALFLSHHQTAESPWLNRIASYGSDLSANTCGFIIQNPENPQFSGDFPTPFCQKARPLFQRRQTPMIRATEKLSEFQTGSLNEYLKPIAGSQKTTNLGILKFVLATVREPSLVQIFPHDARVSGHGQVSVRYPIASLQSAEAVCR